MKYEDPNKKNLLYKERNNDEILGRFLSSAENYYLCQDDAHGHEKAKYSYYDSFNNKKRSPSEIKKSLILQNSNFKKCWSDAKSSLCGTNEI